MWCAAPHRCRHRRAIGGKTQVQLERRRAYFGVSTEDGVAGAVEEHEPSACCSSSNVVPVEVGACADTACVAQVVVSTKAAHTFSVTSSLGGSAEAAENSAKAAAVTSSKMPDGVLGKMPDAGQARSARPRRRRRCRFS